MPDGFARGGGGGEPGGRPAATNVLGGPLLPCSVAPLTGFFRDGSCNTCAEDHGMHTVCAELTADFLAYSASVGNDLSTPLPQFGFPGLKPGDRWCLCAGRWEEARRAGCAPKVLLEATHVSTLQLVKLQDLLDHAAS
ncbi:DUF2237 domain-containing protein [Acetobacteraceae bacterium H6797]|nr:DUF2237 domain-containing protein [Acetobacteraceae bacterium H6797]